MKAVIKGKFMALSALVKKLERSYTNNLIAVKLRVVWQLPYVDSPSLMLEVRPTLAGDI